VESKIKIQSVRALPLSCRSVGPRKKETYEFLVIVVSILYAFKKIFDPLLIFRISWNFLKLLKFLLKVLNTFFKFFEKTLFSLKIIKLFWLNLVAGSV